MRFDMRKQKPERTSAVTLTRAEWRHIAIDVNAAVKWMWDNDKSAERSVNVTFMRDWVTVTADEINEQHSEVPDDGRVRLERPLDDWAWLRNLVLKASILFKGRWSELTRQVSAEEFGGEAFS